MLCACNRTRFSKAFNNAVKHFEFPVFINSVKHCLIIRNFLAGFFIPDVVMAAIIGVVTGWCVGPLIPICGRWLARSSILQVLLHLSVLGLALSSQFFPYSADAPKRVVFQHSFLTAGIQASKIKYMK